MYWFSLKTKEMLFILSINNGYRKMRGIYKLLPLKQILKR